MQYSATVVINLERRGIPDARLRGHDELRSQATSVSFGTLASTERLRPWAFAT